MLITYRNHSIIRQIEKGVFDFLVEPADMELLRSLSAAKTFKELCPRFNNIKIVSKPFHDAVQLSIGKVYAADLHTLSYSDSGTFLRKTAKGYIDAFCYDFVIKGGIFEHLTFFYFQDDVLIEFVNQQTNGQYVLPNVLLNGESPEQRVQQEICSFMDYYLFTKYAEVVIKEVKPKSRLKDIDCKYVNETSSTIKILDSTWFTTLVRSDAFKVRGHFRLQPHGPGLKERKLIWISDFEKQGYIRNFKRPINIDD